MIRRYDVSTISANVPFSRHGHHQHVIRTIRAVHFQSLGPLGIQRRSPTTLTSKCEGTVKTASVLEPLCSTWISTVAVISDLFGVASTHEPASGTCSFLVITCFPLSR